MRGGCVREGSYTVEAALVIPVILYALFALCYLTFYLYDKVVVETEVNRTLRSAEMEWREEEGIMEQWVEGANQREWVTDLVRELEQALRQRLVNLEVLGCQVERRGEGVWIRVSAKRTIGIPVVESMLGARQEAWEREKDVHDPCESVRRWMTVSEAITR